MNALDNANTPESSCNGLASFAFPRAKSSKPGVSVEYARDETKYWYVLRILYGHTREAADILIENGNYVYVAMVWKMERKDGKKHRKLVPFLNLLFAYLTREQASTYVKELPHSKYITYYYDHFHLTEEGKNPPLTISEKDISLIIRATALQDEHVMEVEWNKCKFVSNDIVTVTDGPFKGITGRVARIARQNRVVVFIKGLQAGLTTAYIPPYYLKKVDRS